MRPLDRLGSIKVKLGVVIVVGVVVSDVAAVLDRAAAARYVSSGFFVLLAVASSSMAVEDLLIFRVATAAVIGFVTPCMVRLPATSSLLPSPFFTEVLLNVIAGYCLALKKSGLRRWLSRWALAVISSETFCARTSVCCPR